MNDRKQEFSFSPELCSSLPASCRNRKGIWLAGFIVFSAILFAVSWLPVLGASGTGFAPALPLELVYLPNYVVQTIGRMLAGLMLSLLSALLCVGFIFRSRWAARCLLPFMDVGQSFPVLAVPFLVIPFLHYQMPAQAVGAEFVVVLTIWCSQFWGMVQVMCQRFYGVPAELEDVACCFGLTSWQRFWQLEVPFAIPALVRKTMLSMGGSWFAALYAESVVLDGHNWLFAGLGSYVRQAVSDRNVAALLVALLVMLGVIVLFDQFLFRPLSVWAVRFQPGKAGEAPLVEPWFLKLLRRTRVFRLCILFCVGIGRKFSRLPLGARYIQFNEDEGVDAKHARIRGFMAIALFGLIGVLLWPRFYALHALPIISTAIFSCGITGLRILLMVGLVSLVWIPLGVWLGLRSSYTGRVERFIQYCAVFPANVLFPFWAMAFVACSSMPPIWQSPLIVLGAQWYIALGVLAGAAAYPSDLLEAARNLNVKRGLWWRKVLLPGILPYYLAGLVAATSSAWNAAIAAEWLQWGPQIISVNGIGSFMANAAIQGNVSAVALGAIVMCLFMMLLNVFLWRPLSDYVARRLKLN